MDIEEIENNTDEYGLSLLKLEISGNKVTYPIVNSLRKVCLDQIPIYAFHTSKINILKNTSVFDNTNMRNRLSQLPIFNIENKVKFLSLKYYKNGLFTERHPDDDMDIEYFIKAKNDGPEKILNVTTNDIIIMINNERVENSKIYLKDHPILLIQLRIGEEFECSMKSVLSIGEFDSIFNSSNTYYEEVNPNKYNLSIESSGQIPNYKLLDLGCDIIIEKLNIIEENLKNDQYETLITENNSAIIELINEDHTCGGLINEMLQNMKESIYSGITKPNFMQKNILFKIKTDKSTTPIEIFKKGILQSKKLVEELKEKIEKCRLGGGLTRDKTKQSKKK